MVRHTLRRVKATLRTAQPEDAPRISVLLDQLGWVVPPAKVVVELSASPTTEVVVAELDREVVGLIAVTTRRQFQRARAISGLEVTHGCVVFRSAWAGDISHMAYTVTPS